MKTDEKDPFKRIALLEEKLNRQKAEISHLQDRSACLKLQVGRLKSALVAVKEWIPDEKPSLIHHCNRLIAEPMAKVKPAPTGEEGR